MQKKYDVFISHASEDKDGLVRELAEILSRRGYRVWFDEFELSVGHGLRRSIDSGIVESRYGVLVFSKHFFDKGWPSYELDGLVELSIKNPGILLPIWHNVTHADVVTYSPSLANIVAIPTHNLSVSDVATKLEKTIGEYSYFIRSNERLERASGKTAPTAGQRASGFQILVSKQTDQLINKTESNSRSDVTIYPYSDSYCEHPFHFWQNEPGEIKLIRHIVYDVVTEKIISTDHEITQNDGCHMISNVRFQRQSSGPVRVVCDITSTNQFKGLFTDGFEFVEFNQKSKVEYFSYTFSVPDSPVFRQIEVFANDDRLLPTLTPGCLLANYVEREIVPGAKLNFSLINRKIVPRI